MVVVRLENSAFQHEIIKILIRGKINFWVIVEYDQYVGLKNVLNNISTFVYS